LFLPFGEGIREDRKGRVKKIASVTDTRLRRAAEIAPLLAMLVKALVRVADGLVHHRVWLARVSQEVPNGRGLDECVCMGVEQQRGVIAATLASAAGRQVTKLPSVSQRFCKHPE
jgi:hypothetical protein